MSRNSIGGEDFSPKESIILQDLIATLDQIMDALPADALFSSDL